MFNYVLFIRSGIRSLHWLDAGVSRENILYLNFFDDRLHGLRQLGLGVITDAYYSLYPEKKNTETVYCFFDEIQACNDALNALKYFNEQENDYHIASAGSLLGVHMSKPKSKQVYAF